MKSTNDHKQTLSKGFVELELQMITGPEYKNIKKI